MGSYKFFLLTYNIFNCENKLLYAIFEPFYQQIHGVPHFLSCVIINFVEEILHINSPF